MQRTERLRLVAALYVSQAIPLGFFIVALPAILRSRGAALVDVGLLGALALPWLLKFLWAPLVDRRGSATRGHYRSWIVPLQVGCVATVVALAALGPDAGLPALLGLGALFMLLSATQDVATDGLTVRLLPAAERGEGNGAQVAGYFAGQLLGGGLVLVLYERAGWGAALGSMALLLAAPLLLLRQGVEPRHVSRRTTHASLRDVAGFFRRPGAKLWVATLVLYRAGDAAALTMLNPMLVDRGLSLEEVGVAVALVASAASLLGAVAGGALIDRLGRKPALAGFGLLQAVALCAYLAPVTWGLAPTVLYPAITCAGFAGGLATAALYASMMDRSDPDVAATDFTVQQSLCAVGPMLGSMLSGVSATALGYGGHFVACAGVALVGAALVAWRLTEETAAPASARG